MNAVDLAPDRPLRREADVEDRALGDLAEAMVRSEHITTGEQQASAEPGPVARYFHPVLTVRHRRSALLALRPNCRDQNPQFRHGPRPSSGPLPKAIIT